MENKFDTNEIEESLRICEELLQENPEFNRRAPRPTEALKLAKDVKNETEENNTSNNEKTNIPIVEKEKMPRVPVAPQKTVEEPAQEVQPEVKPEVEPSSEKREKPDSAKKTEPVKKNLITLGICIVVAIVIALFITNFVASHTKVEGNSMENTLDNGDDIIVEKFSYLTSDPERYDIIVFCESESVNYIKRVIALPGETIQITDGKIYINERAVFDAYGNAKMEDGGIAEKPIKLGQDEYFVLGDNRNASKDSRDEAVGVVKRDQIVGKAWLRVLPFDHFGKLE